MNTYREIVQQPTYMATREDDTATATLAATEWKLPTMDWSVEALHKEFLLFKFLANMQLETKDVPDHK